MATTAKGFTPDLVSTNVVDDTQLFDITKTYEYGEIVRQVDGIYSTTGGGIVVFYDWDDLNIGDVFEVDGGQKYEVITKYVDESPNAENTVEDGYQDYKKDIDGFPYNNSYTIGPSDTVTFVQISGTLWEKTVSGAYGYTQEVTIKEHWEEELQDQEYFIYDECLYRRTITHTSEINTRYYTATDDYMSPTLTYLRPLNQDSPFDPMNTSYATTTNTIHYVVTATSLFNAFTLAGVTASSLTYTVKDSSNATIKTDTIPIDCTLDDDGLLPLGEVTLLISVGEVVDIGGVVEIDLTGSGAVKLGSFTTNIAVDEGMTELSIKAALRDYNDYTPNAWGEIAEGVKAVTRTFDITVLVPYADFDKTYRRHKSYAGEFITLDGTDATVIDNNLTLYSLVARGLITSIGHETLIKNNDMDPYYRYNMSFLEVV